MKTPRDPAISRRLLLCSVAYLRKLEICFDGLGHASEIGNRYLSREANRFLPGTPLGTALEFLKLIWGQSCLAQNTPQYANWNLTVMWNNRCTHLTIAVSDKLYMTASLADDRKSCLFQLALDLAIGKGFKRH